MSATSRYPFDDDSLEHTVEIAKQQPDQRADGSAAELEVTEALPLTSGDVDRQRPPSPVPTTVTR